MIAGLGATSGWGGPSFLATVWNSAKAKLDAFDNWVVYGNKYPEPPMPTPVGSTVNGNVIPAVPASEYEANATIQAITNASITQTQNQNQEFFNNLENQLEGGSKDSWWKIGLVGVAVAGVVSVAFGGKKR